MVVVVVGGAAAVVGGQAQKEGAAKEKAVLGWEALLLKSQHGSGKRNCVERKYVLAYIYIYTVHIICS